MAACGKRELSLSKAVGTFHPVGMGWIVFFDGDCAFCSGTVRWLVLFDWRCNLRFSPLQGELARAKGLEALADPAGGTMVVLRESDGATFTYSDAWLEVTRALGGPWRMFGIFRLVPRCLRDAAYRAFARNRYRWFGKTKACPLPDPAVAKRLL